jgi:hypothetical protein
MKLRRSTAAAPKDSGFGPATQITLRQVATIVLAAMFVSLLIPLGASAAGGLSKVLITDPINTDNKAHVDASGNLQVGGTVNVGNSPTVNVGNTPTVGFDPSANTVNVVSDPERQAFQVEQFVSLPNGTTDGESTVYTVPANQRLVVTNMSAEAELPSGERPFLLKLTVYPPSAEQWFPLEFDGSVAGEDLWHGTTPTTLVANSGSSVAMRFERDSVTGGAGLAFTVTGYLIDCTTQLPCN